MPILTLSILCTHCTHSSIFPVSSPAISRWCRWPLHPKLVSKERQVGLSVRCIQIGFHIIEKPQLIHFGQINFSGVFEDETAHVFLVDEINIAVLLFSWCGAAMLSFEVGAVCP